MAIYKPTNCTPFLTTFDCRIGPDDEPIFFECRIDSSNRNAAGYSVTVYDENNDQVFPPDGSAPDEHISQVSDLGRLTGEGAASGDTLFMIQSSGYLNLNTGLNGSYLKFPFFLNSSAYPGTPSNNNLGIANQKTFYSSNVVYYNSDSENLYWYSPDGVLYPINMYNGNTYKWVITLYQGDAMGITPIPVGNIEAYKYFDMQITTGEIMGSLAERIQTVYSDKVYIDYYIEPVKIAVPSNGGGDSSENPEAPPVGEPTLPDLSNPTNWILGDGKIVQTWKRTRIKNIDSTYGYLYPQIDDYSFDPSAITRGEANAYRIYQMGNDPEVLSTTRKVDKAVRMGLPLDWHNMVSDSTSSYGQMAFHTLTGESAQKIVATVEGESGDEEKEVIIQSGTMSSTSFSPWYLIALKTWEVTKDAEGNDAYSDTPAIRWFCTSRSFSISTDERILLAFQIGADSKTYYGEAELDSTERPFIATSGLTTADITNDNNGEAEWGVGSAYNGIYSSRFSDEGIIRLVFSPPSQDTESSAPTIYNFNTYQISWDRTSDAESWGNLSTKIVMIQHYYGAGENIQTNIREEDGTLNNGAINLTPFSFIPERPIQLYNYTAGENPLKNNTGIIFYNGGEWAGLENEEPSAKINKLYISPFVGIERGMYWIEQGNKNSLSKRRFIIDSINKEYWYITYLKSTEYGAYPDNFVQPEQGTPYVIKSYFRTSDENPFDLYENPTIEINVYRNENHDKQYVETAEGSITVIKVDRRNIWCEADYNQADFISWKSFQWYLYEGIGAFGNPIQTSGIIYDGKLAHRFYGLVQGRDYTIVLVLETNTGLVLSKMVYISASFTPTAAEDFPFSLTYDCQTQSVYFHFGLSGFILPNTIYTSNGSTMVRYQNSAGTDTSPPVPGVSYANEMMNVDGANLFFPQEGVVYQYASSSLRENQGQSQLLTTSDTVTFESSHILRIGNSWGNIVGFDFVPDEEGSFENRYDSFQIYIPKYFSPIDIDGEEYECFDSLKAHQMLYGDTRSGEEGVVTIIDDNGSVISDEGIFDATVAGSSLITSPIVISSRFQKGGSVEAAANSNSLSFTIFKEDYPFVLVSNGSGFTYYPNSNGSGPQYKETFFDFLGADGAQGVDAIPPLVKNTAIPYEDFYVKTASSSSSYEDFLVKTSDTSSSYEKFQLTRATLACVWSDNKLARVNVAYSGRESRGGGGVSFAITGYIGRQVENMKEPFIWEDENDDNTTNYWMDGDTNGVLAGLCFQTDVKSPSTVSYRGWSNLLREYKFDIRVIASNLTGARPSYEIKIFKKKN